MKSKIVIPKLTKKLFPYNFYLAHWIDTNSSCTWESIKTIKNYKPSICISTGWLVSTNNNSHTFVSDVNFNDDGTIGDCGNTTTIPSVNIIKLHKQILLRKYYSFSMVHCKGC